MGATVNLDSKLEMFINGLSEDKISGYFSSKTFHLGKVYYEDGHVIDTWFNVSGDTLIAKIEGSREYETSLKLVKEEEIEVNCSCAVNGNCKHIAALMFYSLNEQISSKTGQTEAADYKYYLSGLSKEELVEIILNHAEKDFFSDLGKKFLGSDDAEKIFMSIEKAIKNLLKNEDLLNDPENFSKLFTKHLQRINGLEHHIGRSFEELIFEIIVKIDEAVCDGMLYDHYRDRSFEVPESFDRVVINYTKSLLFDDKVHFLHDLEKTISDCSFNDFSNLIKIHKLVFQENELSLLKELLIKEPGKHSEVFIEECFAITEQLLVTSEKIIPLNAIVNKADEVILKLCNFYLELNNEKQAKSILEKWLSENDQGLAKVYIHYLNLLDTSSADFDKVAVEALNRCADHEVLIALTNLTGESDKKFEEILKKKSSLEFLKFLEKSERIADAVKFASKFKNDYDLGNLFSFFTKYKISFPKEAESYFAKIIDYHLKYTGDFHYSKIEESIRQIRIINPDKAAILIYDICRDYKRRYNLTSLLKNI